MAHGVVTVAIAVLLVVAVVTIAVVSAIACTLSAIIAVVEPIGAMYVIVIILNFASLKLLCSLL